MATPVDVSGRGVTPTDRSGTITSGGTAQELMPANSVRSGFSIQNNSAGDLWISAVGTASAGGSSMRIPPGALYEAPMNGIPIAAVSLFGATTSQAFSAREW